MQYSEMSLFFVSITLSGFVLGAFSSPVDPAAVSFLELNVPAIEIPSVAQPELDEILNNAPAIQYHHIVQLYHPKTRESVATTRGAIQNFVNTINTAFQEIIRRQQQLLDLLSCKKCTGNNPWQNFLQVMTSIPALSWVSNPTTAHIATDKFQPEDTLTANTTLENGVTSSSVNGTTSTVSSSTNQPIVDHALTENHNHNVKPVYQPMKMILQPIIQVEESIPDYVSTLPTPTASY